MNPLMKGALIASAVAGLVLSTAACGAPTGNTTQEVKCSGINDCKGQGACEGKLADGTPHDCAGKNDCKGQGWVKTTKADCDTKGGTVVQ